MADTNDSVVVVGDLTDGTITGTNVTVSSNTQTGVSITGTNVNVVGTKEVPELTAGNITLNGTSVATQDYVNDALAEYTKTGKDTNYESKHTYSNIDISSGTILSWAQSAKCGDSTQVVETYSPSDMPNYTSEYCLTVLGNGDRKTVIAFPYLDPTKFFVRSFFGNSATTWRNEWTTFSSSSS